MNSRFLLQSVFTAFILPILEANLLILILRPPITLRIILYIVAIPLQEVVTSAYTNRRRRQDLRRLGAKPIPQIRGRLPGNIDVLWKLVQSESHEYCADILRIWADEYGPTYDLAILWSHQIVTADPANFKEILATGFSNFEKGIKFHDMLASFLGEGIFTTDGDAWKYHRSMARPFFAHERSSDMQIYERHMEKVFNILGNKPRTEAIDIQDLCARFTMDSITEFLFGSCTNTLDEVSTSSSSQYSKFLDAFNTLREVSNKRVRIGSIWPLFELSGDKMKAPMKIIDGFVDPIIQEAHAKRRVTHDLKKDGTLLDFLLNETSDMKVVRDSLLSFLLAGRDTTAALLTFTIYALTLYPDVMIKVRQEISQIVGDSRAPAAADVKRMKYLRAVLNETLRLFPPVPINIRRTVVPTVLPSPLSNLGPLYMQEKISVSYAFLLMQRRKDVWGEDAEEFNPERWLVNEDTASSDEMQERLRNLTHVSNPFAFVSFNAGPRMCLGQSLAYQECSYFLVRLLQNYQRFTFAPDAQPPSSLPPVEWKGLEGRQAIEKVWVASSLTLYVKGGLWLRAQPADQRED